MKKSWINFLRTVAIVMVVGTVAMPSMASEKEEVASTTTLHFDLLETSFENLSKDVETEFLSDANSTEGEITPNFRDLITQCIEGASCTSDSQCVDYHGSSSTCRGACISNQCVCP